MDLYEEYEGLRDRFEIVAFHDRSAPTFEKLDLEMENVIERAWKGRNLPFPVLLDATGKTYKAYSVRALGTSTLIDPEGRVVRGDSKAVLEAALERMRREER